MNRERSPEAIPALEETYRRTPTPQARLDLAQGYLHAAQPAKALPLVAAAIEDAPNDFELRMLYGRLLRDERKFGLAGGQFLAAVRLKPDSLEAWNELTTIFVLLNQYPQVIAALDRVRANGQEQPIHLYIRAITLDKMKVYPQALESYEKFLAEAQGKYPDEEFKSRQRARIIKRIMSKR